MVKHRLTCAALALGLLAGCASNPTQPPATSGGALAPQEQAQSDRYGVLYNEAGTSDGTCASTDGEYGWLLELWERWKASH